MYLKRMRMFARFQQHMSIIVVAVVAVVVVVVVVAFVVFTFDIVILIKFNLFFYTSRSIV